MFGQIILSFCVYANNAKSIYERAVFLEKINEDSAIYYFEKIVENESLLKNEPAIYAKTLRKLAVYHAEEKEEQKNILIVNKAIAIFKSVNSAKEVGITYNTKANIYQLKGYYDLAIENYLKAASIFDTIQFYNGLTICYSNIASIYNNTEQYKNALQYNLLAFSTAIKKNDTFGIGMIANDVSIAFAKNNVPDSAIRYAKLALQFGNSIQNDFILGYAYKAFFEQNKAQKNWKEALNNTKQSLNYLLRTNSKYDISFAYCNAAECYLKLQDFPNAKLAINKANAIAIEIASFQLYKRVFDLQKQIAEATGDYKSAYKYALLYQQYNDSVFYEKRNNTLNELETKYQTAKKENEIARQKIEIQQEQLKSKQARTRFIISIVLFFILAIAALFLYLFFKQRQKLLQNKITTIEQQKKLELAQAVIDGEENERTRLAKELHDGIGGLMSMLKLRFTNFKKSVSLLNNNEEYDTALDLLNTTSQDIRKISHALMPTSLERLGLVEALTQFCTQIEHSTAIEVDFQHYQMEDRLPTKSELLVYRIIQELLNNSIKYAEAKNIIVQIAKQDNLLSITVEDDGKGFDLNTIKNNNGIGLNSMQQRLNLFGGKIDIDTAPDKGTAINIELPIQ